MSGWPNGFEWNEDFDLELFDGFPEDFRNNYRWQGRRGFPFHPPVQPGLSIPQIKNCKLKMDIKPSTINLIQDFIPIDLGIFFNQLTSIEVVSGQYLPANDTLNIAASIPTNLAPNFIILITDLQANLTIKSGATTLVNQNPVIKVYFNPMVMNSTYLISDLILDGTTTALVPMSQTKTVHYTLVYGVGVVS